MDDTGDGFHLFETVYFIRDFPMHAHFAQLINYYFMARQIRFS